MLTVHPVPTLSSALSALIISSCFIGLTLSKDVYEGNPRRDFFLYYTNLSNLAVLLYFSFLAPPLYPQRLPVLIRSCLEFGVAMCILLTHVVFHFMILPHVGRYTRQADSPQDLRIMAANTVFVHYIVPWLTLFYWLVCSTDKHRVPLLTALIWPLFPAIYAAMIFLRARSRRNIPGLQSPYPYPFLDVDAHGMPRVLAHCAALFLGCAAFSCALLLVMRSLFALSCGG